MELAQTVVYLKNRSPTTAVSTTPYEKIFTILKGVSSRDKVFNPGRMCHLFDFCSYPVLFAEIELCQRRRLFLRENEFRIHERDNTSELVAEVIHRQPLVIVNAKHSMDEVVEEFPG